jgi:hypothetical protein
VDILRLGCRPAPFVNDTQQLEFELRIAPARVYCYLGRTLEQFGEFCIAFHPLAVPVGEMCPFDSGGLVRKIPPVNGWSREQQSEYLNALTFSTAERESRIASYPAGSRESYLESRRPEQAGPHEVWTDAPVAEIWRSGTHWRAWTWEGRWHDIPLAGAVRAWSCSPSLFMDIVEAIEASEDLPAASVDQFLASYRPGGVGALIADLRAEQS